MQLPTNTKPSKAVAASPAALADSQESVVLEMAEQMETLAAAGAWSELEDLVVRLRSAVARVPEAERHDVLVALRQTTERVSLAANNARQEVTGRISAIRRGQIAAKAYGSSKSSHL